MNIELNVLAVADPAIYAYTDERYKILKNYTDKTGININLDIVEWNDYYDTMIKAFEGETNYDIVMVAGHLWLKDFVNKNYISKVEHSLDYDKEDILKTVREEIELDGTLYLYPSFCDGHILLYRKSVVKECIGKLPNTAISTDELIEMVSLCSGYNGMYGIVLKAHPSEIFLDFLPYLRNEGIDCFNEKSHIPLFNSESGKNALIKYLTLKAFAPVDTCNYGNNEVKDAFRNLKTVFAVTWGGQLGMVLSEGCKELDDIGYCALKTSWNVTWSFGINSLSNKKEEANKFLQYLSSKEIDRVVGKYAGSPVRKSTYEIDYDKYPWYKTHLEMIEKYAKPLPKMDNAGTILGVLYESINDAFNFKTTVKNALCKAEKDINSFNFKED